MFMLHMFRFYPKFTRKGKKTILIITFPNVCRAKRLLIPGQFLGESYSQLNNFFLQSNCQRQDDHGTLKKICYLPLHIGDYIQK